MRRSMRIFSENPKLEDCIGMGVVEACHYEHVDDDQDEEGRSPTCQRRPQRRRHLSQRKTKRRKTSTKTRRRRTKTKREPQTPAETEDKVFDPPMWMLHSDGSIHPINRATKDRFHNDKAQRGKRLSAGVELSSPRRPRLLLPIQGGWSRRPGSPTASGCCRRGEKSHPYTYGKGYILNDGSDLRVGTFTPPGVANPIWYTWDGTNITEVDRAAIARELYGLSKEQIPDADMTHKAKLLEGHKTYELLLTLSGTIRLTGIDEDDAKKILDADWKDLVRSVTFNECEAVDVHEAPAEKRPKSKSTRTTPTKKKQCRCPRPRRGPNPTGH